MLHKIIATALGAGYSPIAPGTAGALVAAVFLWLLQYCLGTQLPSPHGMPILVLILVFVFTALGIYASGVLEEEWGKDPGKIVIDEVVGMWISMLWIPFTVKYLFIGFLLFRIFDIWKPWHVARAEHLPGGWGIMMDDVVAGLYACILMHLILYIGW
ncbi:MAG: phosphatidylglycerophosphatase A [Bacteroidota bacterium]